MIDDEGKEVVKMPPPNQRCPCGSKKVYKKCDCFNKDRQRTAEFISGAPKKEEKQKEQKKLGGDAIIMV